MGLETVAYWWDVWSVILTKYCQGDQMKKSGLVEEYDT
jgi:hypothetical protein